MSEIFKVGKMYKQRRIVFTEEDILENSHSDQDLALTSGEESSVYLPDNQEHSEIKYEITSTSKNLRSKVIKAEKIMSVPSRKRKEAWADPKHEITSTSKNLRSKAIKADKISDFEAEASKNT